MSRIIINDSEVDVTEQDGKKLYEYFVCTCSQKDKAFWENEVKRQKLSTETLVSSLIYGLESIHGTWVTGIGVDMWCGISLDSGKETFYIQCDLVEYGLLAALMILDKLYPERLED